MYRLFTQWQEWTCILYNVGWELFYGLHRIWTVQEIILSRWRVSQAFYLDDIVNLGALIEAYMHVYIYIQYVCFWNVYQYLF